MKSKQYLLKPLFVSLLLLSVSPLICFAETSTSVNYSGTLVALPCTIDPGQENQNIMMGTISTQLLYRFTRTEGKLVQFELKDCDTSIASYITATLTGDVNSDGLLKFTPGSEAKGAGIGLEYLDGRSININNGEPYRFALRDGDMTIRMKAYVQAESDALAAKSITAGYFSSILTYTLNYE